MIRSLSLAVLCAFLLLMPGVASAQTKLRPRQLRKQLVALSNQMQSLQNDDVEGLKERVEQLETLLSAASEERAQLSASLSSTTSQVEGLKERVEQLETQLSVAKEKIARLSSSPASVINGLARYGHLAPTRWAGESVSYFVFTDQPHPVPQGQERELSITFTPTDETNGTFVCTHDCPFTWMGESPLEVEITGQYRLLGSRIEIWMFGNLLPISDELEVIGDVIYIYSGTSRTTILSPVEEFGTQ